MKNIFLILLVFALSKSFSQVPLIERSFMPMFNSGLNSVVHDSLGYFYSAASSLGGSFDAPGFIVKHDQGGNIQFEKYYSYDDTYLNDLLITPDGNIVVCGYSSGCDFGYASGLIFKITPNGDTLWTKKINTHSIGTLVDNRLLKIVSLRNGNLLFAADTTIYLCSGTGDSLFTFISSEKVNCVEEGMNGNIICGVQSGILVFDSLGQIFNQIPLLSPTTFVKLLPDSTYLIATDSSLSRLDSAYNLINQFDLTTINYSTNHIDLSAGKIWATNSTGSDFVSFNFNLQLIDSFRTQGSSVRVNSLSVFDSNIVIVGMETAHRNYSYIKFYSTSGNADYYPVDLALTNVTYDTAFVDQPSPLPSGVYRLSFVSRITVENTGLDTIRNFFVNCQSFLGGPCGPFTYTILKENLNVLPGQTYNFPLDTLSEYGLVLSSFPYYYQFCVWISCPNYRVDKDHSNDYLCDTIQAEDPNSIAELRDFPKVNIYPNPSGNLCTIELPEQYAQGYSYVLYDSFGKVQFSGSLPDKMNSLNLSDSSSGVYFIKIVLQTKTITKRIIKL